MAGGRPPIRADNEGPPFPRRFKGFRPCAQAGRSYIDQVAENLRGAGVRDNFDIDYWALEGT